jgi:hypothetical protein
MKVKGLPRTECMQHNGKAVSSQDITKNAGTKQESFKRAFYTPILYAK